MTLLRLRRFGSADWSFITFEDDELGEALLAILLRELRMMQQAFEPSLHIQLAEDGEAAKGEWTDLSEWDSQ